MVSLVGIYECGRDNVCCVTRVGIWNAVKNQIIIVAVHLSFVHSLSTFMLYGAWPLVLTILATHVLC